MSAKKVTSWRNLFGPNETMQRIRPTESFEYIPNPHKGTTTYQRFNGEAPEPLDGHWNDAGPLPRPPYSGTIHNVDYPDTTVVYLRWLWKTFEPKRGQRNWALLDKYFKTAEKRGQTVQFRFNTYDVGFEDWWYWNTGATKAENGEPNVNDPLWYECFGDLIREFGQRYDGHPLLDTVDTVYGGLWGESGGNATRATAEKFIDLYMDAFRKTNLMVMEGENDLPYAVKKKLGWRADCFGDLRHSGAKGVVPDHLMWNHQMEHYPFMLAKSGCQDCWKYGPVTMETCWHVGGWWKDGYDLDFIISQGLKFHMTYFMPKSCAIPAKWLDKIVDFNKKMGYRFVPRQMMMPLDVRPGQNFQVQAWIDNVGCAPIYRPYRFALKISQGKRTEVLPLKADIRTWMPDFSFVNETLLFPTWPQNGEVKVAIGLVDAKGNPCVRFAIQEVDKDGWHPVTNMQVVR